MTVIAARKTNKGVELAWDSFQGNMHTNDSNNSTLSKCIDGNNFHALGTGLCSDIALFAIYAKNHAISEGNELGVSEYMLESQEWKSKKNWK